MKRLLLIPLIMLFTFGCDNFEFKKKEEKVKKIVQEQINYNFTQLTNLKEKWSKKYEWNNHNYGFAPTTYEIQKSYDNNKISIDSVSVEDLFMVYDESPNIKDPLNLFNTDDKYRATFKGSMPLIMISGLYYLSVSEELFLKLFKAHSEKEFKWTAFGNLYIVFRINKVKKMGVIEEGSYWDNEILLIGELLDFGYREEINEGLIRLELNQ